MAQYFRAAGRLGATGVDSPLIRVLGSLGSRFVGLLDPISVPENQNKPQHKQKALPAPPACLAGTLHIFLNILPPYIRRSPSPGLLVRPWHIGLDVRLSSTSVPCVTGEQRMPGGIMSRAGSLVGGVGASRSRAATDGRESAAVLVAHSWRTKLVGLPTTSGQEAMGFLKV